MQDSLGTATRHPVLSVTELNRRLEEYTHVVVNFRELQRFEEKFDFAERFGPGEWELFRRWLATGLEPIDRFGNVTLYRIPRVYNRRTHERAAE